MPVALYQGASLVGSAISRAISRSWPTRETATPAAIKGWLQHSSRATTTTCGAAMITQASQAAASTPSSTGNRQHAGASIALDRLEIVQHMMPTAPKL